MKTIQKWDRLGILPARRTITHRRYYTDEGLALALGLPRLHHDRRTVAYCRISSEECMSIELEIVSVEGEHRLDSRLLARYLDYEHETVMRNITRHKAR